jgi:hypothetical protein
MSTDELPRPRAGTYAPIPMPPAEAPPQSLSAADA